MKDMDDINEIWGKDKWPLYLADLAKRCAASAGAGVDDEEKFSKAITALHEKLEQEDGKRGENT